MMLDTATLFIVATAVNAVVALLVVGLWRGSGFAGTAEIKIGLSAIAVGLTLGALRSVLPGLISIALGNALITCGQVAALNGALLLAGRPTLWRLHAVAATVAILVLFYFLWLSPSLPARTVAVASWGALGCLTTGWRLLSGPGLGSRATRIALGVLLVLHSQLELYRAARFFLLDAAYDLTQPNSTTAIFMAEVVLFSVSLCTILVQLYSERLQADLRRAEERLAAAFGVASDAFVVFDPDGRLIVANPRFAELFPVAAPALRPGATLSEVFNAEPRRFGLDLYWFAQRLAGREPSHPIDQVRQLPDGRWLHLAITPSPDGGLVMCWSDVSDFKRTEGALATELARERDLAAMQRSFVSMASHQFRTPLAIIDVNARLLAPRDGKLPEAEELKGRLDRIRRTVGRMAGLIETILGAASTEAGRIRADMGPCDIAGLVREACDRANENSDGPRVEADLTGLPSVITGDAMLLDQVIGNLLSNAIKYAPGTERVIVTGRTGNGMAEIAVTDFGVGIAPADLPRIFDRFYRAANAQGFSGTGIGLTLARTIVELHGGAIEVTSSEGAGSTFTVTLPIERSTT